MKFELENVEIQNESPSERLYIENLIKEITVPIDLKWTLVCKKKTNVDNNVVAKLNNVNKFKSIQVFCDEVSDAVDLLMADLHANKFLVKSAATWSNVNASAQ